MEVVSWLIVLVLFVLAMLVLPAKHDPAIRLKEWTDKDKDKE